MIVTPDVVGERMAGPGIRAWHFADELAKHFPTTLVGNLEEGASTAAFPIFAADSREARDATRNASVLIGQPARRFRRRRREQRIVYDLFDPILLELNETYGRRPSLRQRIHLGAEWWRLRTALSEGDLLICATARQRDLYNGVGDRMIEIPFGVEMSVGAPAPGRPAAAEPAKTPAPTQFKPGEALRIEPLSVMRKKIAQHMILSKQTSAHVTTAFDVDFTNVEKLRSQYKESFAERGVKLTYLPFIVQAVIAALRDWPILNASMDENNVLYHRDYNIGIAVALEWGLIVPVVKNADEKNILGLARTLNDLGERARTKRLSPDEVSGGTFTITNPGIYGGLFGTPIINQPQVAILGVGGVKKRPIVVETEDGDFIAIRSMGILTLTFDHRLVDGAVADQFMAEVKSVLEAGQFTL